MVRIYGNVMLSPPQDVNLKQDEANVAGRKKIVYVDASSGTIVPAGSEEIITIQPPEGKIWRIITSDIWVSYPQATAGKHCISAYPKDFNYVVKTCHNYDSDIYVKGNAPHEDATTLCPPTIETWQRAFSALKSSHDHPLHLSYRNLTDDEQDEARIIRLLFEEEDEAT